MGNKGPDRKNRAQVMLSSNEYEAIDDWRFSRRMASRAAAVREIFRIGMAQESIEQASNHPPGDASISSGPRGIKNSEG